MKYITLGKDEGAKCIIGGERWGSKGYFIKPTIFTEVQDNMAIAKEEIFGPVICILKFSNYDEVIKRANDTQYGLAAGIVTKSIETYQKIANSLRVGTVWVNCYYVQDTTTPSGGYKMSGLGREMGEDCIRLYLEPKTVIVKMSNDTLP
jgi:aldehyde dehydrogenase (NAD+)